MPHENSSFPYFSSISENPILFLNEFNVGHAQKTVVGHVLLIMDYPSAGSGVVGWLEERSITSPGNETPSLMHVKNTIIKESQAVIHTSAGGGDG